MIIFAIHMKQFFYVILSGLLFAFSWPDAGFYLFVFFAFIPLLILAENEKKSSSVFLYAFFSFLIFNIITTYWIYHATLFGAVSAFVINSLLMACAFYIFHKIKIATSSRFGNIAFIVVWISMEFLHLNWDLSWPWLILGNVFANNVAIVQWYEFTGFLGGSFWVLVVNLLLFRIFFLKQNRFNLFLLLLVFLLPIAFSYYLYKYHHIIYDKKVNVVVVQPNVDPYHVKFNLGFEEQLDQFISLAKTKITKETDILLGPETALVEGVWEESNNKYENTYSIIALRNLQAEYPNLNILVGATTYKLFSDTDKLSSTARQIKNENIFYDAYNSAIFIAENGSIQIYHKTKLVPGAEKIPFPIIFNNISALSVDLGGVSGSLGSDNQISLFKLSELNILPLICYESVYGDLIQNQFFDFICILTNDGWWKNTDGYKQHFKYAKLRAIEQRKFVVRSANTGISTVISPKGKVLAKTNWDEQKCFDYSIHSNQVQTFYNQFGDFIGRISVFIMFLLVLITFVKKQIN